VLGIDAHGAEFCDPEGAAKAAATGLAIEDGAWGGEPDGEHAGEEEGGGEDECGEGGDDIEEAFDFFDVKELRLAAGIEEPLGGEKLEWDVLIDFLAEGDEGHYGDAGVAELTEGLEKGHIPETFVGAKDAGDALAADDAEEVRAVAEDADVADGTVAVVDDDAGEIEVMGAEGAEEAGLELIELAGDDVGDALAVVAKAVEEEKMMDEGGGVAEAGADEDGATTDGPEGVDVGAGDEDADGDEGAEGKDEGAFGDALGAAVCGIEAEDVGGGREDDGREHDVRPVGGDGGVEILAETDEDAGKGGEVEEDGIEGEMEGDMQPVLPKGAIGIHIGRIWGNSFGREPLLRSGTLS
jgi:hypothetical protein